MTNNKVIETPDRVNFCGGCNTQVVLSGWFQVDEGEAPEVAAKRARTENVNDPVYSRRKYLGFCLCGNIYIKRHEK